MDIRLASEQDIPLLHELAHRIWWDHYPAIISEAQIRYMLDMNYSPENLRTQMAQGQEFWLLETTDKAFGFIGISAEAPGQYFLHKFYIDGNQQGRGMGARAFQLLLQHYPTAETIRLKVNRSNFKSINFYFKVGFLIEYCLETAIGQGFVMDDFQMLFRRPSP
ncbi:MAG: GNAT family N-acetyltransferase [Lewinellaceae bacterium]|nr:GNAT family N-acetyltransferase [Lewinellaceae bacterium]